MVTDANSLVLEDLRYGAQLDEVWPFVIRSMSAVDRADGARLFHPNGRVR
jgi:hypothetical protein